MKLGIVISLLIVVMLGLLLYLKLGGSPDRPTPATTAPGALDKMTLPADLPTVFEPTNPQADATELYAKAFDFYEANQSRLGSSGADPQVLDQLIDLLIEAMQAGKVKPGFMDDRTPLEPGIHLGPMKTAAGIGTAIFENADRIKQRDAERGRLAVLAVWALGQRAFEDNIIFENRSAGIGNMVGAATRFMHWQADFPEEWSRMDRWADALTEFSLGWNRKYELLRNSRPKIGDILQVAVYDKDPTFRVMALQRLGMLQYNPGTEANLRAIKSVIDKARSDEHPLISRVAEEAHAFTKEQFHRMRM